jgi:hypothetical protein
MFTADPQPVVPNGVRLTIGVDSRTNSLVINASESLHRQVAAVVAAIDASARDARRTTQFVPTKRANARLVRQGLASFGNGNSTPSSSHGAR